MLLSKVEIKDFKKIKEIVIDLEDINILVGANGCGKSSVIQAIHLACCMTRQADRIDSTKTSTVGIDQLDYLPTDDYKSLGHGAVWGNNSGSSSSKVNLSFIDIHGVSINSTCEIRSARNAGISITGSIPSGLTPILRQKKKFFSAYIPGISGIPNREEKRAKKVILKACSYGDSNVVLRNALLLLKESDPNNITLIERWISEIVGNIKIYVSHDDESDLAISCRVEIGGVIRPIELLGTGYLQLIQIFSYILLFNPGVLLVDEPDIHLHPTAQEKLVRVLAGVAHERKLRVILSTHSPFIVRGAPQNSNVYWLENGAVSQQSRKQVELALGWGAFGKKMIIASEDSDLSFLRKIIAQWPDIDRAVAFLPGAGYANILKPNQAKELAETLGDKFRILVHRDRDSLTDDEVLRLVAAYEAEGVHLWFPTESDVEAYFCQAGFLEEFLGCAHDIAAGYIDSVLQQHPMPIREQFNKQRTAHNVEMYKAGGSPDNETVWAQFQQRPLKGTKGKFLYKQLKDKVPAGGFSCNKILSSQFSGQVAIDLKEKIEDILRLHP